jgi:glutamine amidotransferase
MRRCVIIDYGSGNLRSAAKALERTARERGLDIAIEVSGEPDALRAAERLVLPGVGAFADCRAGLDAVPGLVEALEERVRHDAVPFLGICVGMQLMADRGLEHKVTRGLGWIAGDVAPLEGRDLRIPHMGWNELEIRRPHPLLAGVPDRAHVYFVHGYALQAADPRTVVATADYGGPVTAMVAADNVAGTQFHPEKSQALGLTILGNFLEWRP